MERTRGTWMAVVFYGQITIILLLQTVQQVHCAFVTDLKCTGATDGTKADEPCMIKAYLGSQVTLICDTPGYTKNEPDFLTASTGYVCKKKLAADPEKCADGDKATYKSLGLEDVLITGQTLMVPFHRSMDFKGPVTVYGRCAKDANEALYWGIEFIPRPKFSTDGRIISCMAPVTTAGQTCDLTAYLSDYTVFECPATSPAFVPAQTSDRPHICPTALKEPDSTCGAPSDVGGEGLTLMSLKNGATVRAIAFKAPASKSGSNDKVEGYINCKGTGETRFYKFTLNLMKGPYQMAKAYKVCDPIDGAKQGAPCSIELKAGESGVINCAMLTKTAPADLMKSTGSYCTRPVGADSSDVCADSTALWKDIGAEVFTNASNLVFTHKKTDLAKTMTVYGKCFEGPEANYFKVMFSGASSTNKEPEASHSAGASSTLAVVFGILGTVFLATDTAYKIF